MQGDDPFDSEELMAKRTDGSTNSKAINARGFGVGLRFGG